MYISVSTMETVSKQKFMSEERAEMQDSTSKTGTQESCRRASSVSSRKRTVLAGKVLGYVYSYYGTEIIKAEHSGHSLLKNIISLESQIIPNQTQLQL